VSSSPSKTILLVGTGAFVTHDSYGPGVIARSLAQWCARNPESDPWRLQVACRSDAGRTRFELEWKTIQQEVANAPSIETIRCDGPDLDAAYARAHAAFVCVPDESHADYLERALAARVPTWIVKPMTGEGEASRFLAEAAQTAKVPVWVDYHKRFDVSNRSLRSTIAGGEYGRPLLYSVRYSQPRDLPLDGFAWADETDVFTYIGCHYVDQLYYLMPDLKVEHVSARGLSGPVHAVLGGQAWDTVVARIDGRLGDHAMTAQLEVGWSNPLGSPTKSLQVVECSLERGRIFLDQSRRGTEIWDDRGVAVPNPYFFTRLHDPIRGEDAYQGYGYDSIAHFLDFTVAGENEQSMLLENASLPWAHEAARTDAVLDQIRDALA